MEVLHQTSDIITTRVGTNPVISLNGWLLSVPLHVNYVTLDMKGVIRGWRDTSLPTYVEDGVGFFTGCGGVEILGRMKTTNIHNPLVVEVYA